MRNMFAELYDCGCENVKAFGRYLQNLPNTLLADVS